MPTPLDRDRLLKLLALLDSDQDGEALAAARRAVRMLRDAETDWETLMPAHRGWAGALDLSAQFAGELRRRLAAERRADHWERVARGLELELDGLRRSAPLELAQPLSGHPLIDRLLADRDLPAAARARVEAIALWYRRSGKLTPAESADLDSLARQTA
jgi:hypothetical protein